LTLVLTIVHLPNSRTITKMPALQFAYTDILRENSAYIGGIVIIGIVYLIYSVSSCDSWDLRLS
jgi:hypothetical protein